MSEGNRKNAFYDNIKESGKKWVEERQKGNHTHQ